MSESTDANGGFQIAPEQLTEMTRALVQCITGDRLATVRAVPVAGGGLLLLLCAETGIGRLLGRGGETYKALTKVIGAAGFRTGHRIKLVIADNGNTATAEESKSGNGFASLKG